MKGYMARLDKQYRFAVAKALTDTAKDVQQAMPAELEQALDRPTAYTKGGFYVGPASKDMLTATVGIKDRQAEYLRWQVEGGSRPPKNRALRLPGDVELNVHGNMPAGLVRNLIARAKANKRATKGQAKRFGVSQALDLFYGDPADGRPAGIYKRVTGPGGGRLIPVVVMPQQPALYEKRFDFYGRARRVALANIEANVRRAWAYAKATAK